MEIYMLNLALVFISSYLAKAVPASRSASLDRDGQKLWAYPVFFAAGLLIVLEGLRYRVGTDYSSYYMVFDAITPDGWGFGDLEIGFIVLCKLAKLVTIDPQFIFFILAVITNVFAINVIKDYGNPFELAMFLYITTGVYYSSFNGVRQMLAAMIIFLGTRYLFEGNWLKFFILVILSFTIHTSALIMIPAYFIVRRKAFTKLTFVIIGFFIACVFFYAQFIDFVDIFLNNSRYQNYTSFITQTGQGANILRFMVTAAPVVVSFIYRKKLDELNPYNNYLINLCLLNAMIMLIAMSNWIFARFSMYFAAYSVLLLPQFVKVSSRKINVLIYSSLIILFFIYSLFLLKYDSDLLPYNWRIIDFNY